MRQIQFFHEIISSLFSKNELIRSLPWFEKKDKKTSVKELIDNVIKAKGEVSAIVYAENLFKKIELLSSSDLLNFFKTINT